MDNHSFHLFAIYRALCPNKKNPVNVSPAEYLLASIIFPA